MQNTTLRTLAGAVVGVVASNLVYRGIQAERTHTRSGTTQRSITIGRPVEDLKRRWQDAATLRQIAPDGVEVTLVDERTTRWSLDTVPVDLIGTVNFRPAPGGRGTELTLRLVSEHPGPIGSIVDSVQLLPKTVAGMSLRHFKSLVETGEIPTLEHNPSARAGDES